MKDEDIKPPAMVNLSMREDWHNAIEEYDRQAVRMNMEGGKSIIQKARAWEMVHEALSIVKPGWYEGAETGQDAAVKTILDLGAKASAAQPKPSDPEPFDLARAMAGEPIVTRDGRKARFVAHVPEAEDHKVVAFVDGQGVSINFCETGHTYSQNHEHGIDLLMAPKPKRTVWVNMYKRTPEEDGASIEWIESGVFYNKPDALEWKNQSGLVLLAHPIEIED